MNESSVHEAQTVSCPLEPLFETAVLQSQSQKEFPSDRLVPQLISEQARQNPGRIALVGNSTQMTYGELESRASRLAHQLKTMGVAGNSVVPVYMRRSPLAVLASLAVLKAGAAYLPIDPNYPHDRVSFILTDANAPFLLTDSTLADRLPKASRCLILPDEEDMTWRTLFAEQSNRISPEHPAYVIYTSGSTGKPKGVEITHGNLSNLVSWHQKAFAVTAEDRATQFASFGFDAAVWELWPHLTAGAAVYITPEEVRSSAELLKDWLVGQEITISFVPTALAERLIKLDWPASTKLRFLLTGADILHHHPRPGLPFELINNYGPTEATVVATSGLVAPAKRESEQRPSIGRPIDGAEIYIVDESLNPVPRGEVGELCIGGAGVGRGYVNSPELTAKNFVQDPFTGRPDARLYRTGDRGRMLSNGEIEYIGRVDDLIKIRGYRVEPNEIIAVLNTHPAILASAVVQRQDGAGSPRLVAYVVVNHTQDSPTATQLRDLLRSRLPDYMIPAVFVVLPDLPVTSNGKLDREVLPPPNTGNTLPNENYVSPGTVLEEKLSDLAANLLGVTQVGVNDNLFLIGGHSLFGTQLIARIRDNFGVKLPLRSVFESPTPALLAREIEHLMATRIDAMCEDEVQRALKQASPGPRVEMNSADFNGQNAISAETHFSAISPYCVHELFEAQAARTPDAIAVTCEKEMLTYSQLNVRANRIAHWLQEHGVEPDKLVGLCVERSLDAVAALLGILKAGGAYIPLDPAFPGKRLADILEDSQPEVMITQPDLKQVVSSFAKHTLLTDAPALNQMDQENPRSRVQPHNLAYVIFTSGSTGRPKGVQIEHQAFVNFLQSMAREPGLTANDVLVAVTTLSFDIAGLDIFLPLIMGAQVIIARRDVVFDGKALRRILETGNATVMQATPITWRMLLESGWRGCEKLKILCGGEAMPPDLAKELIPRCSTLWNMYGPTETTVWSTVQRVKSAESRIPIGDPIANTQVYIVDRQLRQVPVGTAGELLIGGDGVARGYLNRPELTAERFIPNPFSQDKAARLYKTGDLCQYRHDGTIECLGRDDSQVKIRGYRIELGDIEAVLERHPAVKQAVAKVLEEPGREKRLVAYVVATGIESRELQTYLAERLPKYMVPSIYVNLKELPLTPNRKVDRNALPMPENTNILAEDNYVSPSTGLEKKLSEIVAELLVLERVGASDNFFQIGGHSLFCAQLVTRIQNNFGVELSARSVFESPTPAQLSRQIENIIAAKISSMTADEVEHALERADSVGGHK
jgi:amino acid adenylation domain-containing protein